MNSIHLADAWRAHTERKCEKARERLIEHYQHLASITAGRLFGPLPPGVERDDLVSAGVMGLIKAVDQFDPNRSIKFETYAITLIRGAILEMLRGDDWVPRQVRDQMKRIRRAVVTLEKQLCREPTEIEIAAELGITQKEIGKWRMLAERATLISLEDLLSQQRDGRLDWADLFAGEEACPLERIAGEERTRLLKEGVAHLPPRERTVVALYYTNGMTFKAIGEEMGVSESRAYQLHAQATLRLRGYLEPDREAML
jgi:RNA polymerase sigma factor FliA